MKLADLITFVEWDDVLPEMLSGYQKIKKESIMDYLLFFSKLHRIEPKVSDMRIIIYETDILGHTDDYMEEDEEMIRKVIGRNGTVNKDLESFKYLGKSNDTEFATREADFDLWLAPRENWLGMDLETETINNFSPPQIVADCLWNMTLYSFDDFELRKKRGEYRQDLDRIINMTMPEREKFLIEWPQLMYSCEISLYS